MWKIILQKYALLVFFAKYHKFAETEVVFFSFERVFFSLSNEL